jgi:hypothetical protein
MPVVPMSFATICAETAKFLAASIWVVIRV